MQVQQIVEEIEKRTDWVAKELKEIKSLTYSLQNCNEWDLMTVKKASEVTNISVGVLYRKIKAKELRVYTLDSKKFIRISDIKKLLGVF